MTQAPRTPVKWIVPIPDNDPFGRKTFTMVCRGNADIGSVLNYFVYEASRKVERDEVDSSKIESVTLENRQQDVIAQRAGVSKKTLIAHVKKLEEWNLIVADAYRHRYEVCHKNVTKDILHPPEEIKPKLRGIHVANCKSTISTIPEEITLEAFQRMWLEIVDLRSESVNLHTTIVDLQKEIVKLHSVQSSEGTSQQGFTPVFDTPNSSNSHQEREESSDARTSPAFASSDHSQQSSYSLDGYTQTDSIGNNSIQDGHSLNEPDTLSEDVTQASDGDMGVHGYRKSAITLGDTHGNHIGNHASNAGSLDGFSDHDALQDVQCTIGDTTDTTGTTDHPSPAGISLTQQTPLTQTMASVLSGDARERTIVPPGAALLPSHTYDTLDVFAEDTWVAIPGQATETTSGERTQSLSMEAAANNDTSDAVQDSTTNPISLSKTGQTSGNKKSRGKSAKPEETTEPLIEAAPLEPDMHGIWNHEKVVQYTEWCLGERYRETERKRQLSAAKVIHEDDFKLTLEDYKAAYDERNDEWWKTEQGKLHVTHMKGKERNSGIDRLHAMLDRIAAHKAKSNGKETDTRKRSGSPHTETNPESFISKTLDRERNERRRLAMLEKAAQIRAARDAATTQQSMVASPAYGYACN